MRVLVFLQLVVVGKIKYKYINVLMKNFRVLLPPVLVRMMNTHSQGSASIGGGAAGAGGGGGGDGSNPEQQLCRLRFFIEHVKRTTAKMEQAKSGLHHYTAQQLDMLEV